MTGIAPSVWADEDEQAIVTALGILRGRSQESEDGELMRG